MVARETESKDCLLKDGSRVPAQASDAHSRTHAAQSLWLNIVQ